MGLKKTSEGEFVEGFVATREKRFPILFEKCNSHFVEKMQFHDLSPFSTTSV
jgi:hypothetical protein